jgi:ketosteroid isomerase-like protein
MSQENVAVVRRAFEAWNAGDTVALYGLLDPSMVLRNPKGWPEPGPLAGRQAILRQVEQLGETAHAGSLRAVTDFIDAGDRVVVRFIWSGAGHGPEPDVEATGIYALHGGRIVYMEYFWDHAEALEAVRRRSEQGARAES